MLSPSDLERRNADKAEQRTEGPRPNSEVTHPSRGGGRDNARNPRHKVHAAATPEDTGQARRASGDGRDRAPVRKDALAALDLGTNNCRLLVALPEGQGFRVVDAFSRIVRLGEGVSSTGRLSDAAMDRTVEALKVCARKIRRWRAARIRGVATEACRRAENCDGFLKRVRRETGIDLEIISPHEEAALALAGCAQLLNPTQPNAIVFDIGGGSTEISWLDAKLAGGGAANPCAVSPGHEHTGKMPAEAGRGGWILRDLLSLPVGVVNLTERHGGDRIGMETYEAMVAEVAARLAEFEARHGIAERVAAGQVQMLGTSGTVTTLAGLHLALPRYNRSRVDGTILGFPDLCAISNRLAELDYEARAAYPCIGPERADLVVSGCAILEAIRRTWPVDCLRVADRGLREGILLGLNGAQGLVSIDSGCAAANPAAGDVSKKKAPGSRGGRKRRRRSRYRRRVRVGASDGAGNPVPSETGGDC